MKTDPKTNGFHHGAELFDRLPPQDLDAERRVVGSLLLDVRRIRDLVDVLSPSDFHSTGYGTLYRHLCEAEAAGEQIDAMLLADRLKRASDFEKAGGILAIAECLQSTPVSEHAVYYGRIVARKAAYRRNIDAAWELLRQSHAEIDEPESVVAGVVQSLQTQGELWAESEPTPMVRAAVEAFERFETIRQRGRSFGYATGLVAFDEMHGGLFPGELTVIAARPAMGKTSLACQIAWHFAISGRPVYYASAEMAAVELATRLICGQSGVNSRKVRTGKLDDDDLVVLDQTAQPLGQMPWYIDDESRLTTARIRRCARKIARTKLSLVVVDYIGRLVPEDARLRRYEQIGQMMRDLKSLARELNIPVLCLVQVNRESQKEGRPRLHHLSDSSEIEKEADVVGFLHEPAKARAVDDPGIMALDWSIDKNRNGEVGRIELEFVRSRTMFTCANESI